MLPLFDDGDIKCAAAKVIDHDLLLFFIVKTIRKCCRCRLVDDTLYFKSSDLAGILCSLSLRIVEVSRYSDDCLCDLLTEIILGVCLQFLKDHRGNLLRCIALSAHCDFFVRTHLSLDGSDRIICVRHSLTLCRFADKSLARLCHCDDRRCCSGTFRIRDNDRLAAFHNCYAAVRSTEIDTDNLFLCCHNHFLLHLLYKNICISYL